MNTKHLTSTSPDQTEAIAADIGRRLKGGEAIELISDLGGGKTTFVRGLARGMGSHDRVSSPTFTVSKVYQAGERQLNHFDFYRLHEGGMVAHELAEAISDPHCVVVVEWAEVVHDLLPAERTMRLHILRTGEDSRALTLEYPPELAYLAEAL